MLKNCQLFLILIFIVSCQKKQEPEKPVIKKAVPSLEKAAAKINIHDCTTARDTIFKDGDWIKYIYLKDDVYGVEVKFDGIIDTLDYVFNCNEVNGLIPKIFRKETELILVQGQGSAYRNVIVCSKKANKLVFSEFESGRVYFDAYDYYMFETKGKFCFYNRQNSKEFYKSIPIEFKGIKVKNSEVYNNKIVVIFENGKTFRVHLPKKSD